MKEKNRNLANSKIADQQKNKSVVIGMASVNIIIAIAYYIEVIKKARSMGSYLIVLIGCMLPTIIFVAIYLKKKEAVCIRYIATICFCALYSYIMYTTSKNLAFCYILLVITLLIAYADMKLTWGCCIYAVFINIAIIAKNALTVGLTETQVTESEIIVICLLLAGLFSILVTTITSKINAASLAQSNAEKEQLSDLLATILKVSQSIIDDSSRVNEEMQRLESKIIETQNSMETLAEGAQETSRAIQTQQENTDQISRHIGRVEEVTQEIGEDTRLSAGILKEGQEVMDQLLQQVSVSERTSTQVAQEMQELQEYTGKMQGIMALINNVASQTGLLALNASIEAARAGEAGRGFAVVAGEISNLASQTSHATGDINGLIDNISKSLQEVVQSIDGLLKSSKEQNGYVNDTADNLKKIHTTTTHIMQRAEELAKAVYSVSKANVIITDSIQNISAVTQNMAGSADITLADSKENRLSVGRVSALIEHLNENAQELKKK